MALVHSLRRMHRDLKSGNILATTVQGNVHLKVADFGTAALAGQIRAANDERSSTAAVHFPPGLQTVAHTKGVGTPLWMAPELLAGRKYNRKADLYSFAIVLWEMAAHTYPWAGVDCSFFVDLLLQKLEAGERPTVQKDWPIDYVNTMKACWASNPEDRPRFTELQWQSERLQFHVMGLNV